MTEMLGQDAEIELIVALAGHLTEKSFVDVGAEKGSIARAMFSCELSGVMFEPLPKHLEALEAMANTHGGHVYPWAIAEADDVRSFFVATDANGVELDHFHSLERLDRDPRFRHGRSFDVVCRSLSSLIADGVLTATLGILKIDTEGRDLAVLQGMGAMRPELVICEFFTDGLYEGWHAAAPHLAIEHMRSLGYERYVAFKRVEEFEQCVMGPCEFLPRQWGNLFFFRGDFFKRVEAVITIFLADCERSLVQHWKDVVQDRVAKERVIQQFVQSSNCDATPSQPAVVSPVAKTEANGRMSCASVPACVQSAMRARAPLGALSVVIDVGAHRGAFAQSILRECDVDEIFAFEPHPDNFRALHTHLSGFPQIVVSANAVGEVDGSASFGCNADDATGSVLCYADLPRASGCTERTQVPMVALDTFCHDFAARGRDVRLIKVDTQGYDLAVLKGAEQTLLVHKPVVLLEFIYAPLYIGQAMPFDIEDWMRRRDYRLVGLVNIHVDSNGALAFADALFVPSSVVLPLRPSFSQVDNEASWREQLATFEQICAERLTVIETLDAEVTRLKRKYEHAL